MKGVKGACDDTIYLLGSAESPLGVLKFVRVKKKVQKQNKRSKAGKESMTRYVNGRNIAWARPAEIGYRLGGFLL